MPAGVLGSALNEPAGVAGRRREPFASALVVLRDAIKERYEGGRDRVCDI